MRFDCTLSVGRGVVLVGDEDDDVLEAEAFFLVHPHELVEDLGEGGSSGECHRAGAYLALSLADGGSNLQSHFLCAFLDGGVDVGG